MGLRVIGIVRNHLLRRRQPRRIPPLLHQHRGNVPHRHLVLRVKPQYLAEARHRFFPAALLFQQCTETDERVRVIRSQRMGGLVGGMRFRVAPLSLQIVPKIVVGATGLRVVGDDMGEEGAGVAVEAGLVPGEQAGNRQ